MALIKCSNCEKEISDKAKVCPQCGQPVVLAPAEPEEAKPILCEECGTVVPEEMDACPNCGCPVPEKQDVVEEAPQKVEVTAVNLSKIAAISRKKVFIAIGAVLALIIALLAGNGIKERKLEKEAAERSANYSSTLKSASYTMLMGAVEAEEAGNLIKRVWYNSIYEERDSETDKYTRPNGYFVDDFNDALENLFDDFSFQTQISSIKSNQDRVAGLMKSLKNPPEEYEDAYDAVRELYNAYMKLTNLATNPTGSLKSFSEDFNSADTETVNYYEALQMYLD